MSRSLPTASPLLITLTALGLVLLHLLGPWPLVQSALLAFVVLGLAPAFGTSLTTVVIAGLAGWILELSLPGYPRMGGTALACMIMGLALHGMRYQWPPEYRGPFFVRLAVAALALGILVRLCVSFAAGRHTWGWTWLMGLLTLPLWHWVAFRLVGTPARK